MIPDHKSRVSVTLSRVTLRKLDKEASRWGLHRSTVLEAAVNAGVQQGLLLLAKPSVKDLADGRTVPLYGNGAWGRDLVDQPPSAAPSKPEPSRQAPGKTRPDQYTIVQLRQQIEAKDAHITELAAELQELSDQLARSKLAMAR